MTFSQPLSQSSVLRRAMRPVISVLVFVLLLAPAVHAEPGIDTRPSNLSCVAPPRPDTGDIAITELFAGLNMRVVMTIEYPQQDSSFLYALDNAGRVYRFPNDPSTSQSSLALDLRPLIGDRSGEGQAGGMDMAFHPDFANNGELFVAYTVPDPGRTSYVARYTSSDGGQSFSASGQIILSLGQSQNQHSVGSLFFGRDGYLYIGFGDNLRARFAQDPSNWYGSILRIDVDSGSPYSIPPDNPFVSGGGAPEVYAYGFRNPYRITQDSGGSGEIWAGDVGNHDWEEVSKVVKGGNHGWPIKEGSHCVDPANCDATGLTDPVYDYSHNDGCSVIGGHVYRGSLIPSLTGKYILGDWCTGEITAIDDSGAGTVVESLLTTGLSIQDFTLAPDGEIYVSDGATRIMQLVADNSGGGPAPNFPQTLSDTGCVNPADPTQVATGVIPYDVNTALWSDGAGKRRWLAIPDGTQIDVLPDGDWDFPIGSILIKEFAWNGSPFETRLFVRHDDGDWAGYSYEWNASLTDADLVSSDGLTKQIDGQLDWIYPSQAQCMQCHSSAAGRALGPETAQLNGPMLYPSSGITSNQLETLEHIGLFSNSLGGLPQDLPALTGVQDTSATLSDRSRSYLHSNCANCHRPNGPGQGAMDFRFQMAFEDTGTCNVDPGLGDLGVPGAKILTPGSSASSVASLRMHTLGNDRMPPLGTQLVDDDGTAVIDAWIDNLKVCADNEPADIALAFGTDPIESGGTSTITFTLTNPNAGGLTGANFTNAYPAGMTNTDPLVTGGTCLNVVTTAMAGGASFDVTAADIPGMASCTITVDVTASATGANTTSVLTTNEASDSAIGGSATLTVNAAPPPPPPPPPRRKSGGGSFGVPILLFLLGFAIYRRKFPASD